MSSPEKIWFSSLVHQFLKVDCVKVVGNPAAFARDVDTISRRVGAEGESFLLKRLPELGRSIDSALAEVSPLRVVGFKARKRGSSLPAFLQGLTCLIFADDGTVLNAPFIPAIRLLRQICGWFKKMERGYDEKSLAKATQKLIDTDVALPDVGDFDARRDLVLAQALVTSACAGFRIGDCYPRHGPGAVSGGEGPIEKRRIRPRFKTLNRWFCPIPWYGSFRDASEDFTRITGGFRSEYGLSRLAFVNKDYRGPRVISLEPSEYQWCQQSLKGWLYHRLERFRLTRGHVNFTDQMVNRDLARNLEFDTLDMSEASDRNSLAIVQFLFKRTKILGYLLGSRTPGTILPSGEVLWFKKFAPMGSATCFAVQALVYWALAVSALVQDGLPLWYVLRSVYVYGDDIVIPHGHFDAVNALFTSVGMKFNREKSCISGKFRESCGLDAYDGEDVTPVRLKSSERGPSVQSYVPLVEHANMLFKRGYWAAAAEMKNLILQKCKFFIPTATYSLPILAFLGDFSDVKVRETFSVPEVYGWVPTTDKVRGTTADERCFLRESLSLGGPVGIYNPKDGTRALSRKYTVKMRKRWIPFHPPEFPSLSAAELQRLVKPVEANWAGRSCSLPCT